MTAPKKKRPAQATAFYLDIPTITWLRGEADRRDVSMSEIARVIFHREMEYQNKGRTTEILDMLEEVAGELLKNGKIDLARQTNDLRTEIMFSECKISEDKQ